MRRKRKQKKSNAVSASELAQMGVCERLGVFEHRYGKRSTASQRAAMRRGSTEHRRFYRDGVTASENKGRCYIATLVFGPGPDVKALRAARDRVLRPYGIGRLIIKTYYRTAPVFCALLERWPWLQPVVRLALMPVVWACHRVEKHTGDADAK